MITPYGELRHVNAICTVYHIDHEICPQCFNATQEVLYQYCTDTGCTVKNSWLKGKVLHSKYCLGKSRSNVRNMYLKKGNIVYCGFVLSECHVICINNVGK